jgi:alpha-amylase/alpha-mannosidase (GH57 family)
MSKKYICIHGHFYQPPRENAWIEEIEIQESASPFHDWNERISHECYGPNAVARILNEKGKIENIVSNYSRMSFNFGPTLLSWLEQKAPRIYRQIIDADKESMARYSSHGSAMAQVYNHIIMPLALRRDKETQVEWGILDFEKRFERKAEGMWLAETAVDTETLEVLAENGIKFTVLAPYQAKRYRKKETDNWTDGIDTKNAYVCNLPSGKSINLFFYDGKHSQGVAFDGYLNDGKYFSNALKGALDDRKESQLVNIATDGESYGHHHKNGEMALAYCMDQIEKDPDIHLTNYSQFLELADEIYEVEINENTSWSCSHGIERWRSDCGCQTGGKQGWNQKWRSGLRESLDWLNDEFALIFESGMASYNNDCWGLRNLYYQVFSNRSTQNIDIFFKSNFKDSISERDKTIIIRLLEMQKLSEYMFTSCAWFFNEVSGLETMQVLQYANRGIQLAEEVSGVKLEKRFESRLQKIKSNIIEYGTLKDIYIKWVCSKRLSLTQIGMAYAVGAIFDDNAHMLSVTNYNCVSEILKRKKAGKNLVMVSGITHVNSRVTLSHKKFSFAVIYMGNHHLVGGTSNNVSTSHFNKINKQLNVLFEEANLSGIIDNIKRNFTERTFSFFQLYRDQQVNLINHIIKGKVISAFNSYEKIYNSSYSLLNLMHNNGLVIPGLLKNNLLAVFQYKLEDIFEGNGELIPVGRLKRYVGEVSKWNAELKKERISYLASKKITHLLFIYSHLGQKPHLVTNFIETLELLYSIDIYPDIKILQERVFRMLNVITLSDEIKEQTLQLARLIDLDVPELLEG